MLLPTSKFLSHPARVVSLAMTYMPHETSLKHLQLFQHYHTLISALHLLTSFIVRHISLHSFTSSITVPVHKFDSKHHKATWLPHLDGVFSSTCCNTRSQSLTSFTHRYQLKLAQRPLLTSSITTSVRFSLAQRSFFQWCKLARKKERKEGRKKERMSTDVLLIDPLRYW